jgi:hypothetical protein
MTGPAISVMKVKKLKETVDKVIADGATCIVGGHPLTHLGPNYFSL